MDMIQRRFELLVECAKIGHLTLLKCEDAKTGEPRWVICAAERDGEGGANFFPFGHISEDPFSEYTLPEGAEVRDVDDL